MPINPRLSLIGALALALLLCASAHTSVAQAKAKPPSPTPRAFTKDSVIYISDFELDSQEVQVDKGGVVGEVRPGILERPRKREQRDPQAQARKLVDLMAKSIVSDLTKAGYKAQRLATGDGQPATGAWVHGVFTEVDEGSQLHRAILGFGSGEAKMELYVTLTDLQNPSKPLYNISTNENSGKTVGAVITLNPYVAAAKYVMEKNAPEKTVKKTASEISTEVAKQLTANGGTTSVK